MQAVLIRLTGPERGQAEVFEEDLVRLGIHQTNDIVVDEQCWPMVVPFHAEIRQKDGTFLLVDVSFAGLWVNGRQASEAFLADGDTIQLGERGPQFRFRLRPEHDGRRPFPAIFSDSRAIARAGGEAPLVSATDFVRHLTLGLIREASWAARAMVLGMLLAMVAFLVLIPIFLVRGYRATQQTRQIVTSMTAHLREERLSREELGKRVEIEQERLAQQQSEIVLLGEERERLRSALEAAETKFRRLESERVAAERIIARYGGGVAFIQGALAFRDPAGRPLRFLGMDERGRPLRDPAGVPRLSPDGTGPVATTPFTGSGFLVSRDGKILTNRHVAEPWKDEKIFIPLISAGYKPELRLFRAFFPGLSEAVPLEVLAVGGDADVALLQAPLGRRQVPVLQLDHAGRDAGPGRPVILLGYPAGMEALLAKAEGKAVRDLMSGEISDVYRLADSMAARGMIRPFSTQGHLSDVQPHQLTFDAQTAIGGSGGPLLSKTGRVIGINYAILERFSGANFGIPIRFGLALLEKASTRKAASLPAPSSLPPERRAVAPARARMTAGEMAAAMRPMAVATDGRMAMSQWMAAVAALLVAAGVAAAQEWKAPGTAKSVMNPVAKAAGVKDAKDAYERNCVLCHGTSGRGDGPAATALNPKPRNFADKTIQSQSDGELYWKITEGRGVMPGWRTLPDKVRWGLVHYVRWLGEKR